MGEELKIILDRYKFSESEKEDFFSIIEPIYSNFNFQRRLKDDFPHHDDVSLGVHILSDAAVTYKTCLKEKYKGVVNLKAAVVAAMFHDLYMLPWQNNPLNSSKKFYNAHGFRHPLEAIINAVYWFPEYFKDKEEAKIIIDAVIHHMVPLPVRRFDGYSMELKNKPLLIKIPSHLVNEIIISSNRGFRIGHFSICSSRYVEGRILSHADKRVAFFDEYVGSIREKGFKSIYSLFALVSGVNKNISYYDETVDFKKTRK